MTEALTATATTVREHEGELVVDSAEIVAEDVVAITLSDPEGGALPPWTPGAHVDLLLAPDLIRQYSLCGDPSDDRHIRIGVLRAPDSRGGSVRVHEHLTPGAKARVRGPRNHFPLVDSPRYLFIGGGIGITPLLPMIAEAEAAGADWTLTYGGRSLASMAFVDELEQYGDRVHLVPQDTAGFPDLDALLAVPRADTLVYVCGPEGLLSAVEQRCAGWPPGSLHLERFSAKLTEAPIEGERAFEVELARTGVSLAVPADQSIFDVVQAAGVSVLGSCLEGICGTCETVVLDGEVDHRDSILSEDEQASNEMMMICVSRCRSDRLTLDL